MENIGAFLVFELGQIQCTVFVEKLLHFLIIKGREYEIYMFTTRHLIIEVLTIINRFYGSAVSEMVQSTYP